MLQEWINIIILYNNVTAIRLNDISNQVASLNGISYFNTADILGVIWTVLLMVCSHIIQKLLIH